MTKTYTPIPEVKYRPLPDYLTIKKSDIEGLGVFATKEIEAGKSLGLTHIKDKRAENGYWRTPLGGFINHSDHANCHKEENRFTENLFIRTNRVIEEGEELTLNYTLYKIR